MNVITTSSVDAGHGLFLIVHRSVYVEPAVLLKSVVRSNVSTNEPPNPLTTLHPPTPTDGAFPASVTVVNPQVATPVWSGPAFAVVGEASRVIVTVSSDGAQVALLIVQTNVFAPTDNPVTPDAGSPGVVTVALPAMTVHAPVPTDGALPAKVAVVEQTV